MHSLAKHVASAALVIVGIIHLLPVTGFLGVSRLSALYGIAFEDPNLAILMRHRAVLFGLLGLFLIYAAFRPALQLLALIAGFLIYLNPDFDTQVTVPFFKTISPDLGWGYIIFAVLVIVGTSNAVNLTDGLDGLAIGPVIIAAVTYMIFAYVAGHIKFANYLQINYVASSGEITIFCGALAGAGLGFLWFNAYPAQIFMGDVGSLPLGGALGTVAVITKQEILLAIVGGLFVIEAFSVIFQVGYFKVTKGRRIFRMAPLHHHFELKGWAEPKVIIRFWIIAIALALISMSTLKLR